MESLILSFESVMPIFILMVLGYVLKSINIADKKTFDGINKLVFNIFLPVLLFYNIYKTETADVFDIRLIIFIIISVFIIFCIGFFAVRLITDKNPKRGVILQGFFRSNFAILGIPLADYICRGNSTGLASLMVAVVVPLFNVFAVISLESFRNGKINVLKTVKGIVKNPLIIGCIAGAVFFISGIKLPSIIEKSVKDISSIASPLAIIVLGAGFTFNSVRGYLREIVITVLSRLVIVPILGLTAAILLGFRGEALACLLVVFGSPVAVSSFSMAQQMDGDENLAAHVIVFSSLFCVVTLFVWIFVLNSLNFF